MAEKGKNDQITTDKNGGKETLIMQVPDEADGTEATKVEDSGDVTLEKLAGWKADGNYEMLEQHIRNGNLEVLPKGDLFNWF